MLQNIFKMVLAFGVYVLMLVAALTNNKKMQDWLDGIIERYE